MGQENRQKGAVPRGFDLTTVDFCYRSGGKKGPFRQKVTNYKRGKKRIPCKKTRARKAGKEAMRRGKHCRKAGYSGRKERIIQRKDLIFLGRSPVLEKCSPNKAEQGRGRKDSGHYRRDHERLGWSAGRAL